MEDKIVKGTLFGVINYSDETQVERFIENMTPQQALFCLVQKTKVDIQKGDVVDFENQVLSKAIDILTTPVQDNRTPPPPPEILKFE